MSIVTKEKESTIVLGGHYWITTFGSLYLDIQGKRYEFFPCNPYPTITMTANSNTGSNKHITFYASNMNDDFYRKFTKVDAAVLEYHCRTIEGKEWRTEEIGCVKNLMIEFNQKDNPVWKIDFDYE